MKITSEDALTRYVLKSIYNGPSIRENTEFSFSMRDIAESTGFALSTFRRDPGKYESSIIWNTDFGKFFKCGHFGISLFDSARIFDGNLQLKRSQVLNNPRYSSLWGIDPYEEIDSEKLIQKCERKIKAASKADIYDNDSCCVDLVGAYLDKEKFLKRFEGHMMYTMMYDQCRGYCNIEGPEEHFVVLVNFDYRLIKAFLNGSTDGDKAQEDYKLFRKMIQECMIDDGHFYRAADKKFNFL